MGAAVLVNCISEKNTALRLIKTILIIGCYAVGVMQGSN
jgi:hypothetical protein